MTSNRRSKPTLTCETCRSRVPPAPRAAPTESAPFLCHVDGQGPREGPQQDPATPCPRLAQRAHTENISRHGLASIGSQRLVFDSYIRIYYDCPLNPILLTCLESPNDTTLTVVVAQSGGDHPPTLIVGLTLILRMQDFTHITDALMPL
jgi:hypothetical protein